jgi:acyl carrier protein
MEPNENEVYREIVDSICEQLKRIAPEADSLTEETDLTMDIHIDSVSTMDLVFDLEESFDVSVPLNELSDVRTIRDLASLIVRLKEA